MADLRHCTAPCPRNSHFPYSVRMAMPLMHFITRFECTLDTPQRGQTLCFPRAGIETCTAFNYRGGGFRGDFLTGTVTGGDGQVQLEQDQFMTVTSIFSAVTDDGIPLCINSRGRCLPGPGTNYERRTMDQTDQQALRQEETDFFAHINITAPLGRLNWLNYMTLVAGCTLVRDTVIYDVYVLSSFYHIEQPLQAQEYTCKL
ncbi:hypothetical protein BDV19DRAFT_166979 [Aspergillus venezuelensis]